MKKFSDLNIQSTSYFVGDKIKIVKILNKEIIVHGFKIEPSKYPKNKSGNVLTLQIEISGEKQIIFSGSDVLMDQVKQVEVGDFPFKTTIIKNGEHFEFH
jgi:hypothetical protein